MGQLAPFGLFANVRVCGGGIVTPQGDRKGSDSDTPFQEGLEPTVSTRPAKVKALVSGPKSKKCSTDIERYGGPPQPIHSPHVDFSQS